jgi:hypothetical protein
MSKAYGVGPQRGSWFGKQAYPTCLPCGSVGQDFLESCRNVDSEPPSMSQNKQHVTFVFDLGDHSMEDVKALIDIVRRVLVGLRSSYRTARMMVTCKSIGSDFGLQRPSEVLVEYDRERQGLYN